MSRDGIGNKARFFFQVQKVGHLAALVLFDYSFRFKKKIVEKVRVAVSDLL